MFITITQQNLPEMLAQITSSVMQQKHISVEIDEHPLYIYSDTDPVQEVRNTQKRGVYRNEFLDFDKEMQTVYPVR